MSQPTGQSRPAFVPHRAEKPRETPRSAEDQTAVQRLYGAGLTRSEDRPKGLRTAEVGGSNPLTSTRQTAFPCPCFVRVLARQRSPVRVAHLHRSEPLFRVALSIRPAFVPRRAHELQPCRRLQRGSAEQPPRGARRDDPPRSPSWLDPSTHFEHLAGRWLAHALERNCGGGPLGTSQRAPLSIRVKVGREFQLLSPLGS